MDSDMITPDMLDYERLTTDMVQWMRERLSEAGSTRLIVGLSGGVDSSVCAALAVRSVGPENVVGIAMPYDDEVYSGNDSHTSDARLVADSCGLTFLTIPIQNAVDGLAPDLLGSLPLGPDDQEMKWMGNVRSRMRMVVLYDAAARYNGLVVGTGNLSEDYIGYQTKYGDSGCDMFPLSMLVKGEVRQLALHLGLPQKIALKEATAALWKDQTDETELSAQAGFPVTYDDVDRYLRGKGCDTWANTPECLSEFVETMYRRNRHKLCSPPVFQVDVERYRA